MRALRAGALVTASPDERSEIRDGRCWWRWPSRISLRSSGLRVYVMEHGAIVFEGTPRELKANAAIRREWLEL
jgi:hypothetical protein